MNTKLNHNFCITVMILEVVDMFLIHAFVDRGRIAPSFTMVMQQHLIVNPLRMASYGNLLIGFVSFL